MRPLRQSSRRSSVCAFLICSGELAADAAGTSATDDWLDSVAPRPASETFCANSVMPPLATAPIGSVHSEIAIAADPTRQTQPFIANLFVMVSRLPAIELYRLKDRYDRKSNQNPIPIWRNPMSLAENDAKRLIYPNRGKVMQPTIARPFLAAI